MRASRSASSIALLIGAALLASGCDNDPVPAGTLTVQLPPARPYKPTGIKPGFSEPLTGAAKG